MNKKLFTLIVIFMSFRAMAQWSGQTSSSDIYTPIKRIGSVGIGLDVAESPQTTLHLKAPQHTYLRLEKTSSTFEAGVMFTVGNAVKFYFWSDNDDNNALKITGSGLTGEDDGKPRMMFPSDNTNIYMAQSGGNVGIGTKNPTAKLTVKGGILASEIVVEANIPGPDYVFEDDYRLPSLAEIEAYINANKHLPEVPSAQEMKESGVNIEQMNMLLLKKVEELTLHLIEMKKENDAVKERLRKLEEK